MGNLYRKGLPQHFCLGSHSVGQLVLKTVSIYKKMFMKYMRLKFSLVLIWILQSGFLLGVYRMMIIYAKKRLSSLINKTIKWKSITIIGMTCSSTVLKKFDLLSNTLKSVKKGRDLQHFKSCQLTIFILTENWRLNIIKIKIVAKKKKTNQLNSYKAKNSPGKNCHKNIEFSLGITIIMLCW